ncbi:hypothetical protein Tco_0502826 [Tanacetum coccineum]
MDLETTQTNAAAKLPLLKQGPLTTEEKAQKKNDVKARSMLLMALPNEHQLTLIQGCQDFKIVSQLAILGENISQEDLNLKFLRSLPFEWNTHVVVWRNKPDLETMSFDDLYNNFKIVEQEVKRTSTSKEDASFKDSEIIALKSEIEKLKKEKECNQIKIDKFENASKCLYKLIGSQISDNSRKGVGYNAVPPPPTGLFAPLTIDLSNSSFEELQQPEFKGLDLRPVKCLCRYL